MLLWICCPCDVRMSCYSTADWGHDFPQWDLANHNSKEKHSIDDCCEHMPCYVVINVPGDLPMPMAAIAQCVKFVFSFSYFPLCRNSLCVLPCFADALFLRRG